MINEEKKATLVIIDEAVVESLGLDGNEVDFVEQVSEVEVKVRQGDKEFVVSSEVLGVIEPEDEAEEEVEESSSKKSSSITLDDYDERWLRENPDHPHYYLIEEKDKNEKI